MNNKKLTMIFILIIALLFATITYVSASDIPGDLPILTGNNVVNNENTGANDPITGELVGNNNIVNNESVVNNEPTTNNSVANNIVNNTLPTTGVAGDTTLFVFITICIASAVYAYIKIRKYNNL